MLVGEEQGHTKLTPEQVRALGSIVISVTRHLHSGNEPRGLNERLLSLVLEIPERMLKSIAIANTIKYADDSYKISGVDVSSFMNERVAPPPAEMRISTCRMRGAAGERISLEVLYRSERRLLISTTVLYTLAACSDRHA